MPEPMIGTPEALELWENQTLSRHVIRQYNQEGRLMEVLIGPKKKFHISPKERRINQEASCAPEVDIFQNGMLSPIRLLEGEADTAEIAANPNLIGESDMRDLLKGAAKTLEKKLEEISNAPTLERMVEVAREVDASITKVELVKARLSVVQPSLASEVTTLNP